MNNLSAKQFIQIIRGGKAARTEPYTDEAFQADKERIQRQLLMAGNLIWRGGIQPILNDIRSIMQDELTILEEHIHSSIQDPDTEQDDDALVFWLIGLSLAFSGHQDRVIQLLTPRLQSIQSQTYTRLLSLIGGTQSEVSQAILQAARTQAQQHGINATARQRAERIIRTSISARESFNTTLDRLFASIDKISNASTIAATEANAAASNGASMAYADSNVELVGVFGCDYLEPEWTSTIRGTRIYNCNARNLTPAEAAGLKHHPNHQGIVLPMRFRAANGLPGVIPAPSNGAGIVR